MKMKSMFMLAALAVLSCSFVAFAENELGLPQLSSSLDNSLAAQTNFKNEVTLSDYSVFKPLSETDDFEEIRILEGEMLERANALYNFGKVNKKMTASDIDYSRAVRIYMDDTETVFNDSLKSIEDFYSFLDTAERIWVLQVPLDNQTVTYTFNIGRPIRDEIRSLLSPEQIAEMESEVGHWKIVKVAWGNVEGEYYKDYIRKGMEQESLDDESSVIMIGGTPVIGQPLAIALGAEQIKVIPTNSTADDRLKSLMSYDGVQSRLSSGIGIFNLDDYVAALNKIN